MRSITTIFGVLILIFGVQFALAQNVEYIGSTLWSKANDVEVVGNYAYCAFAMGLMVLDVSDPSAIEFISRTYIQGNGRGIKLQGNYAFLAEGTSGLRIIDVSDPANPGYAGGYNTPGNAVDICLSGNYAYLVCGSSIQILDISDPLNPTSAGSFSTPDSSVEIYVSGNFAYVANFRRSLQIFDISDPHNPVFSGNYDTQYYPLGVYVSGDYAYVATTRYHTGYLGVLEIINVSDPINPTLAATYNMTDALMTRVLLSGNYAFISWHSTFQGGIEIVDITNPSSPSFVGNYIAGNYPVEIFVSGNLAYVVWSSPLSYSSSSLETIDISSPATPIHLGDYQTVGSIRSVFVSDNYAYAIWYTLESAGLYRAGLEILNVSDPYNPALTGSCDTTGLSEDVFVSNNYAYVDNAYGFRIVDVSDPQNPAFCGSFEAYNTSGIFVSGIYAYVAARDSGLYIFDVSNPYMPMPVGSYDSVGTTNSVSVSGNYAYVVWGQCFDGIPGYCIGGLEILDVSDARIPILYGSLEIPHGRSIYIFVSGDFAYVGTSGGLQIVNVSDLGNPSLAGFYPTLYANWAPRVHVSGNYAYLAVNGPGLEVIDVTDPYWPTLAASYETLSGGASDVFVSNGYAYLAGRFGLMILRFNPQTGIEEVGDLPRQLSLNQNYPNPFNAFTRIDFDLPASSDVDIAVYDILGRRVNTLFEGQKQPGHYSLMWDAAEFPSGIYFARLQAGSRSESIRMTLLK